MRACSSSAAYKQDICTVYYASTLAVNRARRGFGGSYLSIDNGIHNAIIDDVQGIEAQIRELRTDRKLPKRPCDRGRGFPTASAILVS